MATATPEGPRPPDPEIERLFLIVDTFSAIQENAAATATTYNSNLEYISVISGIVEPFFSDDLSFYANTSLTIVRDALDEVTIIRLYDNNRLRRSTFPLIRPEDLPDTLQPGQGKIDSDLRHMLNRTHFSLEQSTMALDQLRSSPHPLIGDIRQRINDLESALPDNPSMQHPGEHAGNDS